MHRATLHKSSVDVDVTHNVDVKFNVMGPRAKSRSRRDAPRTTHSAPQLRHGRDTYLPHDVLISINLRPPVQKTGERMGAASAGWDREKGRDEEAILRVYRCARGSERREAPGRRARFSSSGMRNRPVPTSAARCAEERAIYAEIAVDCFVGERRIFDEFSE